MLGIEGRREGKWEKGEEEEEEELSRFIVVQRKSMSREIYIYIYQTHHHKPLFLAPKKSYPSCLSYFVFSSL